MSVMCEQTWELLDENNKRIGELSTEPILEISSGQKVITSRTFYNPDDFCQARIIMIEAKNCLAIIKTNKMLLKTNTWKHVLSVKGDNPVAVMQVYDFLSQEFVDDSDSGINIPKFMRTFPHTGQAIEKILSLVENAKET